MGKNSYLQQKLIIAMGSITLVLPISILISIAVYDSLGVIEEALWRAISYSCLVIIMSALCIKNFESQFLSKEQENQKIMSYAYALSSGLSALVPFGYFLLFK